MHIVVLDLVQTVDNREFEIEARVIERGQEASEDDEECDCQDVHAGLRENVVRHQEYTPAQRMADKQFEKEQIRGIRKQC